MTERAQNPGGVRPGSGPLHRHPARRAAAVLVVVLVGSLLASVPNLARAHDYEEAGPGGAQIKVTPDGYEAGSNGISRGSPDDKLTVQGKGFSFPSTVSLFGCAVSEPAITFCEPLGSVPPLPDGTFSIDIPFGGANGVPPADFRKPNGDYIGCAGAAPGVQCMISALTTSKPVDGASANHNVCMSAGTGTRACTPLPPDDPPSPTTTQPGGTTTSSTIPDPGPQPCQLREEVVQTNREGDPRDRETDPSVDEGENQSSGDLLWVERPQLGAAPQRRQGQAMAYLPPAPERPGQTVMFGGFRRGPADCVLGDTWIWDGSAWSLAVIPGTDPPQPVPGPPARYGHAMAYDGVGIVLFGGYDGSKDLGDTWTWNGTKWTRHCENGVSTDTCDGDSGGDARAPSARARTAMAHNPAKLDEAADDHAVLFGGSRIVEGEGVVVGDTWSWNGATKKWTDHEPPWSPLARATHHMAYRPGSGVVLQGGWNGNYHLGRNEIESTLPGTFTWDGLKWTTRTIGPGTFRGAMAYHPSTEVVVLEGLTEYDRGDGVWDGRSWASGAGAPATAPNRVFASMAQDPSGNVVFFGGRGPDPGDPSAPPPPEFADTWTLVTPGRAEAPGTDERVTIKVDPDEIPIDDGSAPPATAKVTFNATWGGKPMEGYEVTLSTNGDVTFADYRGQTNANGEYSTVITASKTPGPETITAAYKRSEPYNELELDTVRRAPNVGVLVGDSLPIQPPRPVSTVLGERGITLSLDPVAIRADGASTSEATVKLYKAGVTNERVCFKTDGDVIFGAPGDDDCATKTEASTWKINITASKTPAIEAITATGVVSGFSATTDLHEGLGGWLNRTAEGPNPAPGRENASMAYDEADKLTVLFGGYHGNYHRTRDPALAYHCDPSEPGGPTRCPPTPAELVGDTWIWERSAWSKVVNPNWVQADKTWEWTQVATPEQPLVNSPTPREGAAMAYDASSGRLVLFGGHDGIDYLADTWSFDAGARTWTRHCRNGLSPNSSCDALGGDVAGPSKRYVANMASDGTGVVMFAGTAGWASTQTGPTPPDGPGRLHDTWIWRNGNWKDVTPGPPPPPPPPPDSSRQEKFSNRQPIVMPLPPPAKGCPLGCEPDKADPYPSTIPVSGLAGRVTDVNVTIHDLSWTQSGPADAEIMVVAPGGQTAILMSDACGGGESGEENFDSHPIPNVEGSRLTLTFDDSAAAELSHDGPCTSGTFRPTNPVRDTPYECTPGRRPDFFPPPARQHSGSSMAGLSGGANGTWSLYVVDDCPNPPNPAGEAGRIGGGWSIDITTTTTPASPPIPLSSPPGRGRAAMAYHPPTGKVVMYGGTEEFMHDYNWLRGWATTFGTPFRPLGDTWTWEPKSMTWAQEGTGTHPGARRSAAMAHHPRTGQLVLFGGVSELSGRIADPDARPECPLGAVDGPWCRTGGDWLSDTWAWNGTAWSPQSMGDRPPGRYLAGMAPDSSGGLVLVAVSGIGEKRESVDQRTSFGPATTWTWDSNVRLGLSTHAVPADGTSTSVATARVVDPEGKGIAGLKVSFATDGDTGISAVTDHGDGTYSATVTASLSGEIETLTVRTPLGPASASLNEVAAPSGPCDLAGEPGTWAPVRDLPAPARQNPAAATVATVSSTYSGASSRSLKTKVLWTRCRPTIRAPTPGRPFRPCLEAPARHRRPPDPMGASTWLGASVPARW